MTYTSEKQYLINYGWDHFWYDPQNLKNFAITEFIKGPFAKPKLVCSIPYIIRGENDRTPVEFNKGIPNCWAEYLSRNLRSSQKYLPNYELMKKKDEDVVSHLRQHKIYLGQGIPDPWTTYPDAQNLKTFPHLREANKQSQQRKHLKKKKERCLCCEREYLFGCPDKCPSKTQYCPCKDCHRKVPPPTDFVEKCRCSEIFHNWLLENATFHGKKKPDTKLSSSDLSSLNSSNSGTDGEGGHSKERNKFPTFCECLRNCKRHDCYASENSALGSGDHENIRFYFCPYIKNLCRRKFLKNESDKISSARIKPSVSKEIQAEIKPIKYSRTVQTDNSEMKAQPKCICQNKCFPYCMYHCNRIWIKADCPVVHSIPNFPCTSNVTQDPTFACPYSNENHCTSQKPHKNAADQRKKQPKKKKQSKLKDEEEESNVDLRLNQYHLRGNGDNITPKSKIKQDLEEPESTETLNYAQYHKNIFNCQPPAKNFDHLKYLSDYKLKDFLQQEKSQTIAGNKSINQNSHTGSKFINFYTGNSSLNSLRHEGNPLERFRSLSSYKPKYSESSFLDSKMNLRQRNYPTLNARFNYCDQATMTSAKEVESSGNDFINKHVFNAVTVGEESRENGYIKNKEVTKIFQKRRKLLRNRKRRRKLVSSIIGFQDFLTESPKGTINNKDVQDD